MNINEFLAIDNPHELYKFMQIYIKYGFMCELDKKIYTRKNTPNSKIYEDLLFNHYYLQKPEEILQSGYGICFDQVELERLWFIKHNYKTFTYYMPFHNHTFLIFNINSHYGIFERTLKRINGIYYCDSLNDALNYYQKLQLEDKDLDWELYKYENIPFSINFNEFISTVKNDKNKVLRLKK